MTLTQPIDHSIRDGGRGEWLRTTAARSLIAVALGISLVLGGLFVMVDRLHSSPSDYLDNPAHPVGDDQSRAEVVGPAKEIVAIAALHRQAVGYMLMSCKNHDDPPYQGAIFLTFAVPANVRADVYFRRVDAALASHGWNEGLEPNQHVYGKTFAKDGVTAIVYRDSDYPSLGIARIYGQCRNMRDHRHDTTAWTDISEQFTP